MEILFIRHAETELNERDVMHTPGIPVGLTEKGKEQAKRVAEVCEKYNVQALFSSPELRAKETAEYISKKIGVKPVISELLVERNWGTWTERSWGDIKKQLDAMDLQERYTFVPPYGESWQDVEHRLRQILQEIVKNNKNTAVVMHGGALRALLPIVKNTPKETSFTHDFANASISVFEYYDGEFTEITLNNTNHLNED